jgi:hypothetical protein
MTYEDEQQTEFGPTDGRTAIAIGIVNLCPAAADAWLAPQARQPEPLPRLCADATSTVIRAALALGNPYRVGHDGVPDVTLAIALFEEIMSWGFSGYAGKPWPIGRSAGSRTIVPVWSKARQMASWANRRPS